MRNIQVVLGREEMAEARRIGDLRHRNTLDDKHGWTGTPAEREQNDFTAACGEAAAARALGLEWLKSVDTFKLPRRDRADLAELVEVRWVESLRLSLIIRPDDALDRPFVLVAGLPPILIVRGWLYGHEAAGKAPLTDKRNGRGKVVWFVAARDLRDFPIPTMAERGRDIFEGLAELDKILFGANA